MSVKMPVPTDKGHRFQPGNRFWELRSSAGRKPKFEDPARLWECCVEYFQWVEDNPLYEDKLVTFQGVATHEPVAKIRAMTIAGLCLFLDIDVVTWREWRENRPDFSTVIKAAETVIYQQKFTGAAADLLNANIIARDLGLSDKRDLTSSDGSMSPDPAPVYDWSKLSEDELQTVTALLEKAAISD